LAAAGERMGLVHVGSACLNAIRMEKGYKSGHELTNEVTLAEAGLERFSRASGFQGAERSLQAPEKWKLALLRLDEPSGSRPADPLGAEAVWSGHDYAGIMTSGGYGYDSGAWLGWAYLNPGYAAPGTELEVMVLGERRRAEVAGDVQFDPENKRARA